MVEPFRTDTKDPKASQPDASSLNEYFLSGQHSLDVPPEIFMPAPERCSNSQLNRSAEALGRGVGNAVAGVKNLPRQLDRLRSRIHLVHPAVTSDDLTSAADDVVGEWRDAVESGVSEAAESAKRYRSIFVELADRKMQELRSRGERRYFALRRELNHRTDKLRRESSEQPIRSSQPAPALRLRRESCCESGDPVMSNGYTKSPVEILTELKTELLDFVTTRVAMLHSEMQENIRFLKLATPALIVGLVLLGTAWLLLTGGLVAAIAMAFQPNPWAYAVSFLIVSGAYLILGGLAAISAWKRIVGKGLTPWRTIHVLQQDKVWIEAEGKAQL